MLDRGALPSDNYHMTKGSNQTEPISHLLRRTIAQAIQAGQTSYNALERETDVKRASIMRFVRGTQSLRLDKADRLAARFGLELRKSKESR
jgi:hypothetical protein